MSRVRTAWQPAETLPWSSTRAHLCRMRGHSRHSYRTARQSPRQNPRARTRRTPRHREDKGTPSYQSVVARNRSPSRTQMQDVPRMPDCQPASRTTARQVDTAPKLTRGTLGSWPPWTTTDRRISASYGGLLQSLFWSRHPPFNNVESHHLSSSHAIRPTWNSAQPPNGQRSAIRLRRVQTIPVWDGHPAPSQHAPLAPC